MRENLTKGEELFCREYVKHRNGAQAFRVAFPQRGKQTEDINYPSKRANELLRRPEVQGRIDELIAEASKEAVTTTAEVLKRWMAIATADPRELVETRLGCCRYCYGLGFNYQWRAREIEAMVCEVDERNARRRGNTAPENYVDVSGGDGFQEFLDPNPECPECGGEGVPRVVIKDTRNLSPEALLLYGGAKYTKNGIEIIIADRQKAFENVTRILGMFNDNIKLSGDMTTMAAIVEIATDDPEKAAEMYQKMIALNPAK